MKIPVAVPDLSGNEASGVEVTSGLTGLLTQRVAATVKLGFGSASTPASSAAVSASLLCSSRSRAKLITSTLLAVATPMHMIAPVSAGTDKVVPVTNSVQMMPASAPGSAMRITNGSSHDWKFTTMSR